MSPCVKKCVKVRRELALVRAFTHFLTYGECRDSEQSPCDCEPVGMDSLHFLFYACTANAATMYIQSLVRSAYCAFQAVLIKSSGASRI